jgi:hypothetical protein
MNTKIKQNISKSIKTITLASLVGLSTILGTARAGSVSGDIGYVAREQNKDSYAEANVFYGLPGKINGYTYLDKYNEDGAVYGKTTLTKAIADSAVSARVQGIHNDEELQHTGIGLEAKLQTPKNIFATVNCTPVWLNGDGQKEEDVIKAKYYISIDLPMKFNLSSFGEVNVANTKGVTWEYGEIELAKRFGNFAIGYNAGLWSKGDGIIAPKIVNGIAVRYKF